MLSAVAARKAAQQNPSNVEDTHKVPTPQPIFSPPTDNVLTPSRPNSASKRKATRVVVASPASRRKKKPKRDEFKPRQTRYFMEMNPSEVQEPLEEDEDSGQLSSAVEDTPSRVPTILAPTKRLYSPSAPVGDASEDDDGDPNLPSMIPTSASPPPPITLSTFSPILGQNTFHLSSDEAGQLLGARTMRPGIILAMAEGESITFLGRYSIAVLKGSLSLLGTPISPSKKVHDVFSVRCAPLPVLGCISTEGTELTPKELPAPLGELALRPVAVVLLLGLHTGIEGMGKIIKNFDPAFLVSPTAEFEAIGLQLLTHQVKDTQPFILPESWNHALGGLLKASEPSIHLIKGAKRSGKSSFARLVLNRLLTRFQRVAFLECDLGQSEFTPAGMVALNIVSNPVFGPPFSHPSIPNFAHYVGSTSPKSSPAHYLASIQVLVESYRLDVQRPLLDDAATMDGLICDAIPLVVNTMGWTRGLGADLTRQIQGMVDPTHVYEFDAPIESGWPAQYPIAPPSAQDDPSSSNSSPQQFTLSPIPPSTSSVNYTSVDHRSISILSYFHAIFPRPTTSQDVYQERTARKWKTDLPLCARHPYEVDWSVGIDRVILSGAGYEDIVAQEISHVLNGAVVGLLEINAGSSLGDTDPVGSSSDVARSPANTTMADPSSQILPYVQGASVPSPSLSQCRGLALIRSVSPDVSSIMHVLTPVPVALLENTRVMVKGEVELPIWGMLDYKNGYSVPDVGGGKEMAPYLQWAKGEGIGAQRRRVRRNLMRRSQM